MNQTQELPIHIVYPLEHECHLCGCSCMAQLVGPLSDEEHQNILTSHMQLAEQNCLNPTINPIMKGLKPDGSCLYFLNFPEKRCIFLDENHLCHIHGKLKPELKPAACRRFPKIAIRTENEIRLGIKPYCYANAQVCNLTPVDDGYLNRYRAEHWEELKDLIDNASFRPVLRVPDPAERTQAQMQEPEVLSWLQSDLSYPSICLALITGQVEPKQDFSDNFIQALHEIFSSAAEPLSSEIRTKLGSTRHAQHALDLCALLGQPLTHFEALAPSHPFGRYARYALYQAVFLRETSRFPALSIGAFALALGGLVAAQDPDHAGDHLTAWMRLMAQTQLFSILFPTPESLGRLFSA